MMSRTTIAVAGSAGACALAPTAPAATAAPEQAQDTGLVSVFHGIPGTTVDVFANGDEPLGDFQPGTVTEGGNTTVAAHLSADGKPRLTTFTDDVSKTDAGRSRLTVRHVAAAPAVDVRAGGHPLFTGLANPDEDTALVEAGIVNADVVLAGTETVVVGPAGLDPQGGHDQRRLRLGQRRGPDSGSARPGLRRHGFDAPRGPPGRRRHGSHPERVRPVACPGRDAGTIAVTAVLAASNRPPEPTPDRATVTAPVLTQSAWRRRSPRHRRAQWVTCIRRTWWSWHSVTPVARRTSAPCGMPRHARAAARNCSG